MYPVYEAANAFDVNAFIGGLGFEVAMIALVGCIIVSFAAMKLYKIVLSLFGAVGVGYVAYGVFGPDGIFNDILPATFEGIDVPVAVSLGCALLGLLIGLALPKFILFLAGIGMGTLGMEIVLPMVAPTLELDPLITLIIGVVVGVIVGILLSLLFKPVYILITSLGCMAVAGIILLNLAMPGMDILYGVIGGAVVGVIPMFYQFKVNSELSN